MMMKNHMTKATIMLASILFMTTAKALVEKPSGFYIEGNPGWSKVYNDDDTLIAPNDTGFGWNVNAGYKVNRYIAFEGGYYSFTDETYGLGFSGKNNYAVAGDVKGITEIDTGFNTIQTITLFAKLGVADAHHTFEAPTYSMSDSKVAGMAGVGLGIPITTHLGTSAQLVGFTGNGNVPEMFMTTLGLSYIF